MYFQINFDGYSYLPIFYALVDLGTPWNNLEFLGALVLWRLFTTLVTFCKKASNCTDKNELMPSNLCALYVLSLHY